MRALYGVAVMLRGHQSPEGWSASRGALRSELSFSQVVAALARAV
jgi:hypothetical protein